MASVVVVGVGGQKGDWIRDGAKSTLVNTDGQESSPYIRPFMEITYTFLETSMGLTSDVFRKYGKNQNHSQTFGAISVGKHCCNDSINGPKAPVHASYIMTF
jgi:hypothetical protein